MFLAELINWYNPPVWGSEFALLLDDDLTNLKGIVHLIYKHSLSQTRFSR